MSELNITCNQDIKEYDLFDNMDLKLNLLKGIFSHGFEKPSPVQKKAIVPIIKGTECIVHAQSGVGKTGVFSIAMLQVIDESINATQGIIVAPTRDLAQQIDSVISSIGKYLKISTAVCIGGTSINDNIASLEKKPHFIIGTPGRIIDMIERNVLDTSSLKILTLDEADELLSKGFKEQIRNIVRHLPTNIHINLFSATFPQEVVDLSKSFMNNPVVFNVKKEQLTLEGIKQFYITVDKEEWKLHTLIDLYNTISVSQAIIFVNRKEKCNYLLEELTQRNFTVSIFSSELSQKERYNLIEQFKSGATRVLITTDVLSRGIDAQHVSIVINYDIPKNNEIDVYLHRIGRSGRYGRKGVAINFVTYYDQRRLQEIERFYSTTIDEMPQDVSNLIT